MTHTSNSLPTSCPTFQVSPSSAIWNSARNIPRSPHSVVMVGHPKYRSRHATENRKVQELHTKCPRSCRRSHSHSRTGTPRLAVSSLSGTLKPLANRFRVIRLGQKKSWKLPRVATPSDERNVEKPARFVGVMRSSPCFPSLSHGLIFCAQIHEIQNKV